MAKFHDDYLLLPSTQERCQSISQASRAAPRHAISSTSMNPMSDDSYKFRCDFFAQAQSWWRFFSEKALVTFTCA
jgi:hypothetical protein